MPPRVLLELRFRQAAKTALVLAEWQGGSASHEAGKVGRGGTEPAEM